MALTVLGLSGAVSHDPSAALYIDGKLVAAVEEERFVRDKDAKNRKHGKGTPSDQLPNKQHGTKK